MRARFPSAPPLRADQPQGVEGAAGAAEEALGHVDHRHRPAGLGREAERRLALDEPGNPLLFEAESENLKSVRVLHLGQRDELHRPSGIPFPLRAVRRPPLMIKTTFRTEHGTLLSAPTGAGAL